MAKSIIQDFYIQKHKYLLIHYSCESFKKEGTTPRITSIAIKCLSTGQTDLFSLTHASEELKISINEENHDILEKKLLRNFFHYVRKRKHLIWIHWGMKDNKFGFKALEHRANILGLKNIYKIEDDRKYDLSKILIQIHGYEYVKGPKLDNLLKINQIKPKDFLTGETEARFSNNNLNNKISQSTLAKVHAFEEIIQLQFYNKLKVNKRVSRFNINLLSNKRFNAFKETWIYELFICPTWNNLFSIVITAIIKIYQT